MKKRKKILMTAVTVLLGSSLTGGRERLIVVDEGLWQSDNGRLTYFEDGEIVSNQWFRDVNGYKLGDTPNDIIMVNPDLIAIAMNWSNIVQFITPKGRAVAATEDIPNNRKLCSDGEYVYVTSYAHECKVGDSFIEFTKGYVAKIEIRSFKVTDAVEVGYEPEGIALYKGYLFVANTGGYAFQEGHDYETTVSVIDAKTMEVLREVNTGQINLYGKMSVSGQYLCINSPGDYYSVPGAGIIFDCEAAISGQPDEECFTKLDLAATYNCTDLKGDFYAIGSRYSYHSGEYEFNYSVLNPSEVMDSEGADGVSAEFPGSLLGDLKSLEMPYGIYVNPYSGYIYATDAGSFASSGMLYQWTPDGTFIGKYKTYINPAHFLALPDDENSGVGNVLTEKEGTSEKYFNLFGMEVFSPRKGEVYIHKGKKIIYK